MSEMTVQIGFIPDAIMVMWAIASILLWILYFYGRH